MSQPQVIIYSADDVDKIPMMPDNNSFTGTNKFGSATDYTEIDNNGNMQFIGGATVFDDLLGDITQIKTLGTGVSSNNTENTLDYTAAAVTTDYAYINYQVSHQWKAGSGIYPHIHWEQNQNATPNWLIQYRWQANGQAKTTAWTNYKCTTNAYTYVSGTLNQVSYGAVVTPPAGYSLSDIIQFRIIRDTANTSTLFAGADAYTGVASITGADIHLERDTVGSKTEYTK